MAEAPRDGRRLWRKIERVDPVLVFALLAIVSSYALGYRLDWRRPRPSAVPASLMAAALRESAAAKPVVAGTGTFARWRRMTGLLARDAARYPGRVAIFLRDFRTRRTWSYHPDALFPAASLVKLPLMACVFYKIRDGQMSLDQRLTLRQHNRVGGSGTIKWSPNGTRFSVQQLLVHLISESDNTAANMLLEAVGLGYAQKKFSRMGLLYTGIYKEGMSLKSGRVAHENYTTAREMSLLLDKIYRGRLVDAASSRMMLNLLLYKKPYHTRLAKGLPRGWRIAHKTGLERRSCHDAAIFLTPDGDYSLTVLTGNDHSYRAAKRFITRLGHVSFAFYRGLPLGPRRRYYARLWRRRPASLR